MFGIEGEDEEEEEGLRVQLSGFGNDFFAHEIVALL